MSFRAFHIIGLLGILGLAIRVSAADDAPPPASKRQPVATCISETGTILRREKSRPWERVAAKERLQSGDLLLAAGDAVLDGDNGAVRLLLVGDAGGTAQLPTIETAVVLHTAAECDLDFTFLRGRVDVVNQAKGAAKVRVRGQDRAMEIGLLEPGTRVALVAYGRWLPGVPFRKAAKPEENKPGQVFAMVVLKGEIELHTARHQFLMHAPPGPALLEGDGIGHTDPAPRRLDKLPDWAAERADSEDVKKVKAGRAEFRELARQKSIPEALDQLLLSDNVVERKLAVALLGATDDIERLANSWTAARTPDILENGVFVIRHWIGREPGQGQKLYQALVDKSKLTPAQAETVLHLLHNFSADELAQPETYETLIDLLASDQLVIRGLAHWHLYRLVPAGRKIGYEPQASPEKLALAVQEWRKLIPAGKLPPSK